MAVSIMVEAFLSLSGAVSVSSQPLIRQPLCVGGCVGVCKVCGGGAALQVVYSIIVCEGNYPTAICYYTPK